MISLFNADTNTPLGAITESDLQFLVDALEETGPEDADYYIDAATIDMIAEEGRATDHLITVLRGALGGKEGVEVRWVRN